MSRTDDQEVAVAVASWRLVGAAHTDQGPVRRENQDAFQLVPLPGAGLGLIVADGMGGQNGGREAAEAAVAAATVRLGMPGDGADPLPAVVDLANEAVAGVRRTLGGNPGTTMVAALLTPGHLTVANAGDSRAYLIRGGVARQLTEDHSLVADQVRAGRLGRAEARHDPRRNYVTRALLGDPVAADVTRTETQAGDMVLLCSDGLWGALEDAEIASLLSAGPNLMEAARRIVAAALSAGATDNVTAAVGRVDRA
ncbi:MAG: protein phosphatase 2C domain-containing protein [Candidatus Dormibacteria bacterium]